MEDEDLYILVTDRQGITHRLPALAGWSVMEIIRDAGLPIGAECGGAMVCATCHIYIDPGFMARLPSARVDEQNLLIDQAATPTVYSRLACQVLMTADLNGLVVTLAPQFGDGLAYN